MSNDRHTAPEDRIPLFAKIAYGLGAFVNNLLAAAVGGMTIVLNLGLGLSPTLVGWLGAIPRVTDALTDPLMGYISDNTRSRWGRRRPYIFLGAILSGVLFAALWQLPEGKSDMFYFWYFLGLSMVFYLAYTCYATPWVALGYELTPDYHERTRLMGIQNAIGQIAYIVAPWFLTIMQHKTFDGDLAKGAARLALLIGAVTIIFGTLPALLLEERVEGQALVTADPPPPRGFLDNMKDFASGFLITLKSRPFQLLCVATFLVFNGFILISSFQSYVIIYYVFGGNLELGSEYVGYSGSLGAVSTFIVIAVVTFMSARLGKRRAFFWAIGISMVGYGLKWFCYDPDVPNLLLIPAPLMAFGLGGLFTLMPSMVADVCDMDELETGARREGMFGSIFWWVVKVGMAAALAGGGMLLDATGFNVDLGGEQSESTILLLRIFDALIPVLASAIAILAVYAYPITEERALEIRDELEERRGAVSPSAEAPSEQPAT